MKLSHTPDCMSDKKMSEHASTCLSTSRFLGLLSVTLLGTAAPVQASFVSPGQIPGYIEAITQERTPTSFTEQNRRVEGETINTLGGLTLPNGTLSLAGSSLESNGYMVSSVIPTLAHIYNEEALTYSVSNPTLGSFAYLRQRATQPVFNVFPGPGVVEQSFTGVMGRVTGTVAAGHHGSIYYGAQILAGTSLGSILFWYEFELNFDGGESGLTIDETFGVGLTELFIPYNSGFVITVYADILVVGDTVGTTRINLDPDMVTSAIQPGSNVVPEPSSLAMGGVGIFLTVSASWRKQRKHRAGAA